MIAVSELQRRSGQLELARETAQRAERETAGCGERGFHVRALLQLADVLVDQEDCERALELYADARVRAQTLGMRPWIALAWQGTARVHRARAADAEATFAFDRAVEIWTALDAPRRLAQIAGWRGERG
jgi:ATP/maltotriose-dependent transcriptional regulator MalT